MVEFRRFKRELGEVHNYFNLIMFNKNSYSVVNREERFFCFLFAHALLSSRAVRVGFAELAKSKCDIALHPDNLEVYVEVAALRDYWYDLGKPDEYLKDTHNLRRVVLEKILEIRDVPLASLDQHELFWTTPKREKLWSPSHWGIEELKNAGLEKLKQVRWAFNAKPDILLVSPKTMLVIEAKLESGEGRKDETGYKQYDILPLIVELWEKLIPEFQKRKMVQAKLERQASGSNTVTWSDIIEIINASDIDPFTRNAMAQLNRYYTKKEIPIQNRVHNQ
ncbi:hypothetical protein [Candidatus Chlorobium masyuteum]|uniref:hypothetical protein n=1 Tax=Candidatus Chlorobium masyuteum TaxID=2716876 RepID=UPI001AA04CEF|nr:hypothetical protein [Candidatus Chlorobium masyuteum]